MSQRAAATALVVALEMGRTQGPRQLRARVATQLMLSTMWPCPQILSRYDIALVQEVRDTYLTAVGKLLDELNRWVTVAGFREK